MAFGVILQALMYALKFFMWSGLWIGFIAWVLAPFVGYYLPAPIGGDETSWFYIHVLDGYLYHPTDGHSSGMHFWIWCIAWGSPVWLKKLITIFKPDFTWFGIFSHRRTKEKKLVKPKPKSELLFNEPTGFIFGKLKRNFVCKETEKDGHILVIGGAGSGKTSCEVIPSIISWTGTIFAIDIKGELFEKTSKRKLQGSCQRFSPGDDTALGFDPFFILQGAQNPTTEMKKIAQALIPLPPETKEPFFINSARNMLTSDMLYFYEQGYGFIETMAAIQSIPCAELISLIAESSSDRAKIINNAFTNLDEKTLSNIFIELSNHIEVFATDDELREALTKKENITPDMLNRGQHIYVCIPEHKLSVWKPLLTLIVNQFLTEFEKRPDRIYSKDGAMQYDVPPTLFVLDEFARIGKIEPVLDGLATLRSKKVTIAIITQSLAQLDLIYGHDARKVIADNCSYKAILSATDADTQEYFSKLVGSYDKLMTSKTANSQIGKALGGSAGTSKSEQEKKIIKPEEFASLTDIVLLTPYGFARVAKAPYYNESAFQ